MLEVLRQILSSPVFLVGWGVIAAASLGVLFYDMSTKNPEIKPFMKAVWGLTVLYSGFIGLGIYYYSGRKQISEDTIWRKGCRSVSHCYSGCGAGEITGLVIAVGILALSTWWVAAITFSLAFAFGYAMTVGPLMQEGVPLGEALKDAFYSETASIAVMEIVAISTDIWVAGDAKMGDTLFWGGLIFSLSLGLLAAYPVNVLLIKYGVKEGMMNPKKMGESEGQAQAA